MRLDTQVKGEKKALSTGQAERLDCKRFEAGQGKDRNGNVLTREESVLGRWKEFFEELTNEENERERRSDRGQLVNQ